jgi:hypothetical protein
MSSEISTSRLMVQFAVRIGIVSALLFGGAWTEAWLYIVIQTACWALIVLWLKKHNPELIKARTEFWKRREKSWDKVYIILESGNLPLDERSLRSADWHLTAHSLFDYHHVSKLVHPGAYCPW